MEITIDQAATAHQEKKFEEAEKLYRAILQAQPGRSDANNNLGVLLQQLGRLDEAEESYKKAIELKPDYGEAFYNLGVTLKNLDKLDEAEASYRKAIELKPDYAEAHNNLGNILNNLDRLNEAETSYKKAIDLRPNYVQALKNLDLVLRRQELLLKILQGKKNLGKTKVSIIDSGIRLTSNPFITHRKIETELLKNLYKVSLGELDKTKDNDARYGNGRCSNFKFFENNSPIIKIITEDLINIMKRAVKSDVYIMDSFLNIYGAGSGTTPHNHIGNFDKNKGLVNQKYSLTYYLSVGDQNCSEPGNLKIYEPDKEILLSKGKIVILPASRKHSAVYGGKTDRVMIGVNFYSLT